MKDKKDIIMADSASASSETGKTLLDLPDEILINIAFMLTSPQDILAFFQLNRDMRSLGSNAWIWLKLIQRDFGEEALAVFNHQAPDERDLATRANEFYVFTYQAARKLIDNVSALMAFRADSTSAPFFNTFSIALMKDFTALGAWHALPADQQYKTFHKNQIRYQHTITALANNTPDTNDFTILRRAASRGHTEFVKLLLAIPSININAKTNEGNTALTLAATEGHTKIVALLLTVPGIEINAQSNLGFSALMRAAKHGYTDMVTLLLGHRHKVLLVPDIAVNAKDNDGFTALMWAVCYGHVEVVKSLLKHPRIAVNAKNNYGTTALIWAIIKGNTDIIKLLLAFPKIEINARDHEGNTALMQAATRGHIEHVKLLLQSPGINIYANNKAGENALTGATQKKHLAIVALLKNFVPPPQGGTTAPFIPSNNNASVHGEFQHSFKPI